MLLRDIGDPEVGKTSIFLRYTKNQFDYSYQPSVSVSIGNVVKHVNIPYETIVSVSLWDLPGREEMDLRRSYYKDVDAAIGKNESRKGFHPTRGKLHLHNVSQTDGKHVLHSSWKMCRPWLSLCGNLTMAASASIN